MLLHSKESPWDIALAVKPLVVPEQGKFLPAHLGRDGLPGAEHPGVEDVNRDRCRCGRWSRNFPVPSPLLVL